MSKKKELSLKNLTQASKEIGKKLKGYLPLTGGTMANRNLVKNLNAEFVGGYGAEAIPKITDSMRTDGITYGLLNGKWEPIAGPNMDIYVDDKITTTSLAIEALETGIMPTGYDSEVYEEIMQLIGEERFAEISANTKATLELHPIMTDKQKLEKALLDYDQRKVEAMAEAEEVKSLDVEQDKIK